MSIGRALLYSEDEHGKRIAKVHKHTIGSTVMPVRETKPHALSPQYDGLEERMLREGERNRLLARLSAEERLVHDLQLFHTREMDRQMEIPAERLDEFLAGGDWTLVRMGPLDRQVSSDETWSYLDAGWVIVGQESGVTTMRLENGLATVAGDFSQRIPNEEIARLLGLSESQLHRRVKQAHRKLRSKR